MLPVMGLGLGFRVWGFPRNHHLLKACNQQGLWGPKIELRPYRHHSPILGGWGSQNPLKILASSFRREI